MGFPGGMLKDDSDLSKLKEGLKLTLIGSAEEIKKPEEKTVFVEDIVKEGDEDLILQKIPAGLQNIGNTCYLNACLQNLKNIPEIKQSLNNFKGTNTNDLAENIVIKTRDLFTNLEKQNTPYTPYSFVDGFRKAYPRFNQTVKTEMGLDLHAQQDADEFLNTLLTALSTKVSEISSLFSGEYQVTFQCTQGNEEPTTMKENFQKFSCHIEKETTTLEAGLAKSFVSIIEKNSTVLGKSVNYTKTSKISHLPQYLNINFVRFYWKPKEQTKAKVIKDIKFPWILDLFDFCSDDLKKQLKPNREILRKRKEKQIMKDYKSKNKNPDDVKKEDKMDLEIEDKLSEDFIEIKGGNSTGWYELCGVVTHKGKTADSGHYIGWVKESDDRWIKYDDDQVTQVSEDDIKKLSGGGEWHIAYILFYRSKNSKGEHVIQW